MASKGELNKINFKGKIVSMGINIHKQNGERGHRLN